MWLAAVFGTPQEVKAGLDVRTKCPNCQTVNELPLPILLTVCICGALIKGKFDASERPSATATQAADVDHYTVLGLTKSASDSEIKAAYRRRVKETHPDVGGDEEEFKLVQAAYEVLGSSESRKRYDSGGFVNGPQPGAVLTPDFIGMKVTEAVRLATSNNLAARVAIVEVDDLSQLRGRVIGQMPYPFIEASSGMVGLLVAVPRASTLWQRFRVAATELAAGFWSGLKSSTIGSGQRPAELGPAKGMHNAGAVAGEVVGTVAVGAVGLAVGAISLVFRIYVAFGLLIMIGLSLLLVALAPPLGLIFGAFTAWLIYKAFQKFSGKSKKASP